MPLFVFLSGYFSHKKTDKDLLSSIWKLLEPLILFQVLARISVFIVKGTFSWEDILTPWWALWYLLSLIYWRLILQIIPNKYLNNKKLIIITTFCIGIIAGFLPLGRVLSLQRTLSFMPFFFLGYCMKGKNLFLSVKYKPQCLLFLILSISIPLFYSKYLGSLAQAEPYANIDGMFSRMLVFALSIPLSLAFINICPNTSWVARQGRFTLQYYIYHGFMIPPLMMIIGKFNLPMSLLFAAIYTIVITIGIGIASRLPYFTKFTNPSSFFKK